MLSLICTFGFAQELAKEMQNLKWRAIGPANMGGRVTDILGIPGDPSTYYVAGADGGVFKTTNGGADFESLFTDQRAYSVGALGMSQSDKNVLWLGSGEGDPRNSVGYGNGVYRSLDAGETWEHLGLDKTERIKRIVVHPDDPDVACVCALGREWGPNKERGVFRTTDGGENWTKVLYIDEDTGCADLAMDLSNPRMLYAGMWTHRRKPWRFDGGGKETAPYRSKDGGKTWEKIVKGLPDAPMTRIGIAVAQSQPNTIYMITEFKDKGTFFRSDNRGSSWYEVNDDPNINFRPFYYSDIRVDPNNHEVIYSLSGRLNKSTDGGKNFEVIARNVHGDHQALWIDPMNSKRVLSGSDGGYQQSFDAGASWQIINNVELSQFYQLDIDNLNPYNVYGGLQDNGCWRGPSNSLLNAGIMKRHWLRLSYGDGYYAVPIPGSEHEVYTNLQGGVPFHVNSKTGVIRSIHPYPKITGSAGDAIENHKYRFNWDSPIYVSPHNPNTVYFGGNVLFKSNDRGHSWEEISGDLTTNDKSKQRTSGGEIYQDNTAAEFHCAILTIAESPKQAGVIWVGTDDGNLQLTQDGGKNWTNLNAKVSGLPKFSWFGKIHASEHDAGTAFIAVDNHRSDDFKPYAYVTTDFGKTWKKIVTGLPSDDYVKVIRQDPHNPDVLYIGMEHGVYISWDKGGRWHRINNNLPPVSVRDLRIHPRERDLIVGTHGRGVWILDDADLLTNYASVSKKDVALGDIKPLTMWNYYQQVENLGDKTYVAKNPEVGAYVNFFQKEAGTAMVKIYDEDGALIRELEDSTAIKGINRIVWDLRSKEATKLDNPPSGGWRSGTYRPYVTPGTYKVELIAGGKIMSKSVEIKKDPRLDMTDQDYDDRRNEVLKLQVIESQTNEIINSCQFLTDQLNLLKRSAAKSEDSKAMVTQIDDALKGVDKILDELQRPPPNMGYRQKPRLREEIRSLMYSIGEVSARPTKPQQNRIIQIGEEAKVIFDTFDTFILNDIKKINSQLEGKPTVITGIKPKRS